MLGAARRSTSCLLAGCRLARAGFAGGAQRDANTALAQIASASSSKPHAWSRLSPRSSPAPIWQTRLFSADAEYTAPPPATIFGVVKVGAQQFKVVPDDLIVVEKMAEARVNDAVVLSEVIMVGTALRTVIGRPSVPGAVVHAVVEEHFREAKKLAFKKKRRKGYQRLKGHRQVRTTRRLRLFLFDRWKVFMSSSVRHLLRRRLTDPNPSPPNPPLPSKNRS